MKIYEIATRFMQAIELYNKIHEEISTLCKE